MRKVIGDEPVTVLIGDVRERLSELPNESVHCVVTSPPYWGLRDYGVPGQLGLEVTPREYVAVMVEVFREVRRVLRADGTLWLNMGDSYASNGVSHAGDGMAALGARYRGGGHKATATEKPARQLAGLKPKDLVGIPWRVALALQADGWWLRSDIVWSKPNPMPESVTDRPTRAHEYVFLLTRSPRYFYDAEAVRETDSGQDHARVVLDGQPSLAPPGQQPHRGIRTADGRNGSGRNLRSVWTIATQPYPEAHFATFPEKLIEPCIKAGTSERGCCPRCGAPWRRMTSVEYVKSPVHGDGSVVGRHYATGQNNFDGAGMPRVSKQVTTTGWQPSCAHDCEPVPCIVFDPFAGSGTTLTVAWRMGRRSIGIELQRSYLPLIQARVSKTIEKVRALATVCRPGSHRRP